MKKYLNPENKGNHKGQEKLVGKWSEGFSTSKNGKPSKNVKASKTDDVTVADGTVLLIDTVGACASLVGNVSLFAIKGGSLTVGNKKMV